MNITARSVSSFALSFSTILIAASAPASMAATEASASVQVTDINSVSDELLARQVELLKLNTRLKLYLLPRSPWSARRMAGIGFTNATLTATGAFTNGCGRLYYLHNPSHAPSPLFEDAGIVRLLANCVSTGAALFEYGADTYTGIKDKRQCIDLSTMRQRALCLKQEIDDLLDKRNSMTHIARNPAFDEEGTVLADLRNAELREFASYYAQAKGNKVARKMGYLITIVSNVSSGAGTLAGIEANHLHGLSKVRRNHMGGAGGICDIATGSINILSPIATRTAAAIERNYARKAACDAICPSDNSIDLLLAHQKERQTALDLPSAGDDGVARRNASLNAICKILEKRSSMSRQEAHSARNRFAEEIACAATAGTGKITNGIGGTIGGFKFAKDSYHRFEVQGGTAIAYGTGNALAALEIARLRLTNEYKEQTSRKNGTSKQAELNRQLQELDVLVKGTPQLAEHSSKRTL